MPHPQEELRERLAEIEHDQWIAWSKNIAETEAITLARLERWQKLWRPYSELTEAEKDQDREWADKVLILFAEREQAVREMIDLLERIDKEKWKDAQHCTCLGYAIDMLKGGNPEEKERLLALKQ